MTHGLRAAMADAYDRVYSDQRRVWLDHAVVNVSVAGFLLHLLLVFLSRSLPNSPSLVAAVGTNYLAAIYTPFSFILFYEVLMLIAALPQSTTHSIAKQYEIVSLIFIRRFFKDIAQLDDIGKLAQLSPEMLPVFLDVGAGLFMFLLVTVFLHAGRRRHRAETRPEEAVELNKFISRKKAIALALAVLLVAMAVYSLTLFVTEDSEAIYHRAKLSLDLNTLFYGDVFTVMIFTDVLIVILSLAVSDRYELVFRNAAFVISTILIRFSLTTNRQYSALLAVTGMLFGIATLVIYKYHARVRAQE